MANFIVYQCLCSTEGANVKRILRDSDPAPTTCPNDTAHTLSGSWSVVQQYPDRLPMVTQLDGTEGVAVDPLQHPPGWTYLTLGFSSQVPLLQATRWVDYHQIKNGVGNAMAFRAWTGKVFSINCDVKDKIAVELVVKGSALGGLDDTHDYVLDQFMRDIHPYSSAIRQFTPPDKSMLIPVSANLLSPLLPVAGIFFKLIYTPNIAAVAEQHVVFDLEGFEPPAA